MVFGLRPMVDNKLGKSFFPLLFFSSFSLSFPLPPGVLSAASKALPAAFDDLRVASAAFPVAYEAFPASSEALPAASLTPLALSIAFETL